MSEKKPTMNDMVVKKPVATQQVLRVPQKQRETISVAPEIHKSFHDSDEIPVKRSIPYEKPVRNRAGCFLWVIAGSCVIALVIGVGGLFTHATITVMPKQVSGSLDTTLTLSQSHEVGSVFFGTATKTFTSEKIVPSIGQVTDEVAATGTIKFYNTQTSAKTIPAKTEIISSAGKRYVLNKSVIVPPKNTKNPGQAEGGVTAVIVGAEGNSSFDDFTFVKPSKNVAGITMRSVTEITGGTSGDDALADPEMIQHATESLKSEFMNTQVFVARLSEQIPDTMIVVPGIVSEGLVTITLDPKHPEGVRVIASKTVTILVVNRTEIARVIGNRLGASQQIDLTLTDLNTSLFMTNALVAGQPVPKKIQLRITGTATVVGAIDHDAIKEQVVGLSRKDTQEFMDSVPEVDSYTIRMRPFWRRLLPVDENDIEIVD